MSQRLDRKTLKKILQSEKIDLLSSSELSLLIRQDQGISDFVPEGVCRLDPRNGVPVLYSSARSLRPHDYLSVQGRAKRSEKEECFICQGRTTGVLDVADLSKGFTFINKNLFPVLYPMDRYPDTTNTLNTVEREELFLRPEGMSVHGFHFLQWTSSYHDKDWHNMPQKDRVVVMERLAVLERKLLSIGEESGAIGLPGTGLKPSSETPQGFVSIIKNYGSPVGGSVEHGHQQIVLSGVMPRRIGDNLRFSLERGKPFSEYLLQNNPPNLLLADYGPAVILVPYFMRRPFDMMLVLKDTKKSYLHELADDELKAVSDGWHDAIGAIHAIMPRLGRATAFNVVTNNGPGAGLYFEFLPYTQEMGGYEHLGLFVCQEDPLRAAAMIRNIIEKKRED